MGFSFGGIKSTRKRSNESNIKEFVLSDKVSDTGYYIILIDHVVKPAYLAVLEKDLSSKGINNYVVASCISSDKIEKDSTDNLLEIESNWRSLLKINEWTPKAVLAFGGAVRVVAGSGDIIWTDFLDFDFNNPFFYVSSEFRKITDKLRIYAAAPIEMCYPLKEAGTDYISWPTRHLFGQMTNMVKNVPSKFKYNFSPYEIIDVQGERNLKSILKRLCNSDLLSMDTETNKIDYTLNGSRIHCIQLTNDGEKAYWFLFSDIEKYGAKELLTDCLSSAKKLVGSNLKFDTKWLWSKGVKYPLKNIWTTDNMSHALNSGLYKGLKSLAFRYTYFGGYDLKLDEIKKKLNIDNYTQIPKEDLMKYSGLDVIVCWRIFQALKENIEYVDKKYPNDKQPDWTIWRFIEEIYNPNYHTVLETEYRGVFMNMERIKDARKNLNAKIDEIRLDLVNGININWIDKLPEGKRIKHIDKNFPFESQKELGILLEKIRWPCIERSKSGEYATNDVCIERWNLAGIKEARLISDMRSYQVGIKTFVGTDGMTYDNATGWPQYIRSHADGSYRCHPNTLVMTAESFRHKMTSPNFQQIPTRGDIGKFVKKCISVPAYTVDEEYVKITDDNGKEWTTEYTDYFETERCVVHVNDLLDSDVILKYAYPEDLWKPKNIYESSFKY